MSTVTLIEDSAIGLPTDELYSAELAVLRTQGRRIGEVSALAQVSTLRVRGVAILMRLLRLVLVYAVDYAGLDDLCLAVNPRHVEFYQKFFHCRPFGPLKSYAKVNGAPAVALRLDLARVRALTAAARRGAPLAAVDEFLYGTAQWRRLGQQVAVDAEAAALSPEHVAYFFAQPTAPGPAVLPSARYAVPAARALTPAFAAT